MYILHGMHTCIFRRKRACNERVTCIMCLCVYIYLYIYMYTVNTQDSVFVCVCGCVCFFEDKVRVFSCEVTVFVGSIWYFCFTSSLEITMPC